MLIFLKNKLLKKKSVDLYAQYYPNWSALKIVYQKSDTYTTKKFCAKNSWLKMSRLLADFYT